MFLRSRLRETVSHRFAPYQPTFVPVIQPLPPSSYRALRANYKLAQFVIEQSYTASITIAQRFQGFNSNSGVNYKETTLSTGRALHCLTESARPASTHPFERCDPAASSSTTPQICSGNTTSRSPAGRNHTRS